jgi:hypothetical protein
MGDDGPWTMGQTYNLSLSHDPTSAITLSGNMRYATTQQQAGDKTTTLAPSATISLTNDIFRFNLSGTQNERQTGSDPTSINRSWSSNLSSNLDNPLWPQLRLSYSEANNTNDAKPVTIDTDSNSFAASIDYNWEFIDLLYNYRTSTSTNNLTDAQNKSDSQSTNIQFRKTLFSNKLSLSASHQYSINNSTASSSTNNGLFILDVSASSAYADIDNTPLNDALPAIPALNDNDLVTATTVELPPFGDQLNVALQINLETFNRLSIYFDRSVLVGTQQRLHWTFYTSQDNDLWTQLSATPSLTYTEDNGRTIAEFTFTTPIVAARYIKAVVETDIGFDTAFITELQAFEQIDNVSNTEEITSKNTTENIQASINYRPWSQWQLGYSFNRSTSDPERGVLSVQDNHSVNSHLDLNRYFAVSCSVSENTDAVAGMDDQVNRSYAFSYRANPLNDLNFSLNGTRSNHFDGNTKDRSSDSISSNISTVILPDLSANISYMWSKSQNFLDASTTNSSSYTFNLMARINERLNLSYYYSYNDVDSHRASLSYRPSDLLSLTASIMQTDATQSYSSSLHWRITPKIQTDLRYSLSCGDQGNSHNSRFNLSWDISSYLSVRQSIDWNKTDTDSGWSGLLSASYNF